MALRFEHEIRQDLIGKVRQLEDLHRMLARQFGPEPLPAADTAAALELAAATVRDCAVCQEDHFGGLIALEPATLGETIVALRAAETIIKDVIACLLPAASRTSG
jgi:hypothetical protein